MQLHICSNIYVKKQQFNNPLCLFIELNLSLQFSREQLCAIKCSTKYRSPEEKGTFSPLFTATHNTLNFTSPPAKLLVLCGPPA